jgi:hypothetical protein
MRSFTVASETAFESPGAAHYTRAELIKGIAMRRTFACRYAMLLIAAFAIQPAGAAGPLEIETVVAKAASTYLADPQTAALSIVSLAPAAAPDWRNDGVAGVEGFDQPFTRQQPIAAVGEELDQLPIDRTVHPRTHPQTAAVRRCKETFPPKRSRGIGRSESERNRWSAVHYFERAEGFSSYPKVWMAPGRRFRSLRKRQAQPPGTREHWSVESRFGGSLFVRFVLRRNPCHAATLL